MAILSFPHFWLMVIGLAFFLLSVLMVLRHKPDQWFLLHKISAAGGVIFFLIGVLLLLNLNLRIFHAILGLIAVIWLIGEILGGTIAHKKKDKIMRNAHIQLGRLAFIFTLVVLILGILSFL